MVAAVVTPVVMIAPGGGAGHATRAAAICRWMRTAVIVVTGPGLNEPLTAHGIPFVECDRDQMADTVRELASSMIIGDYNPPAPELRSIKPDVWLWRLARERSASGVTADLEGPDGCWPIVSLTDAEILTRDEARAELGVKLDRTLRVAVPTRWQPGIVERMSPGAYVLNRMPALRYLRAADHVIGHAGYNLFAEVNALSIPATWLALNLRQAPDQLARLHAPTRTLVPDAAQKLAATLDLFYETGRWEPTWKVDLTV